MSKERFAERKADLQNAVKRLQEAVAQPENDLVRDAVIQRFEFTFELATRIYQHVVRDFVALLGRSSTAPLNRCFRKFIPTSTNPAPSTRCETRCCRSCCRASYACPNFKTEAHALQSHTRP
jgi:hypothetical protein